MAYTDEKDAAHLLTSIVFGGTTIKGVRGGRWSFEVNRVEHRADGNLGPTSRPANLLDLTSVIRFLDGNSVQAYTASPATLTFNFKKGSGSTMSAALANMLPGTYDQEGDNGAGEFPYQQVYQCQTSSPAVTVTQ